MTKNRTSPYKAGDLVWRDLHVLSDATKQFAAKLAPRRDGPFKIVKMISSNVVILCDEKDNKEFGPINVVNLTPYHEPVIPNLVLPDPVKLDRGRPNRGGDAYNLYQKPRRKSK